MSGKQPEREDGTETTGTAVPGEPVEWFGLEGTLKAHPVPPLHGQDMCRTRVDVGVQLEVVLPAEELLADLALELAAAAMCGDVAPQVPLAGEHLQHRDQAQSQQCTGGITAAKPGPSQHPNQD